MCRDEYQQGYAELDSQPPTYHDRELGVLSGSYGGAVHLPAEGGRATAAMAERCAAQARLQLGGGEPDVASGAARAGRGETCSSGSRFLGVSAAKRAPRIARLKCP